MILYDIYLSHYLCNVDSHFTLTFRMGPRAVRDISTSVRNVNRASGINPFTLSNCADLGDCPVNPLDVMDALKRITGFYKEVVEKDISPLSVGGDHLVSLPVLRYCDTNVAVKYYYM